jgi:hypothetical protein
MGYRLSSLACSALPLAALIAAVIPPAQAAESAGSPFEQLSGDWKGGDSSGTYRPVASVSLHR